MVLVEATVQIPEQIPEDPRMRHWTFARSDNNAIRLKTIHHMSLDPMTLEPLTGQPYSANLSEEPRRKLDDVSTKIVAKVNMRAVENRARAVAAAHGGRTGPYYSYGTTRTASRRRRRRSSCERHRRIR